MIAEHERRAKRLPFKATSPSSLAKSSLKPPGLLRLSIQLQRQFSPHFYTQTLGINEKQFQRWQSYNVAWAHQEWHRFAFFHVSFTRVAHKHQTVTRENNHQVDIYDITYAYSWWFTRVHVNFSTFCIVRNPLYSPCCFLPEERLQRQRSQRRFDYLMGKIRRCGAAGPCRCIDVQKKKERENLKVPGRMGKTTVIILQWFDEHGYIFMLLKNTVIRPLRKIYLGLTLYQGRYIQKLF